MHPKYPGLALLGTAMLVGCVYVPLGSVPKLVSGQLATAGKASVQLMPQIANGVYTTQSVIKTYSSSDVQHLVIQVFKTASGSEVPLMDAAGNPVIKDVTGADIGKPVTFTGLHPNIAYRFKAYAYTGASTASANQISIDANSSADVTLPDETKHDSNLPVKLRDSVFDGQATTSVNILPGSLDNGQEGLSTASALI